MAEMSEDDFYKLQGDSYRGSKYANFTGGGITPQGNVSSAATENSINKVGTSASASDAPPTPTGTASSGLTAMPNMNDAVMGMAIPYAGQVVGQAAGSAIGAGSNIGEGLSQGFSSLANKVSGGLVGSASTPTNIAIGQMGGKLGPATKSSVDAASKASNLSSTGTGASIGSAAGSGIGAAAAKLLSGGNIGEAAVTGAKTAVGSYVGTAIGTAVAGPIGGFVGGTIGSMIGGRVICTQLVADGLLEKEDQRLDMEFTFKALSNIHVRGYLFWARPFVDKMKKNPVLRDKTLKIVVWRLNEIKYKMGLRDKPDYRGKIVRLIMENLCFIIGLFLPDDSVSVIYKKGTNHVRSKPAI